MSVEIILEEPRWDNVDLDEIANAAAGATFTHLGLQGLSLACLATNDAQIAELNAQFRGKQKPTNVLSWPSETLTPAAPGDVPPSPVDPEIGDIALSYETCFAEAEAAGLAFPDHLTHLTVHGILHLLGYDHEEEADADLMEKTEIAILMSLGIDNPYR